eukprot:6168590-Lingulodinium_polyedra.AAC.1
MHVLRAPTAARQTAAASATLLSLAPTLLFTLAPKRYTHRRMWLSYFFRSCSENCSKTGATVSSSSLNSGDF